MKVQIKGYKKFHGHDGQGFDASIWIDGKRTAIVSDDGWGGGYQFHALNAEAQKRLDKLETLTKALPALPTEYDFDLDMDLELWISELVELAAVAKNRKVTTKGPDGEFYTWNGSPYAKKRHDQIQAQIDKASEGHVIVNRTPAIATI